MSMQGGVSLRGAAPVGHLHELDTLEALAVLYLRLWWGDATAQAVVRADFTRALGDAAGATAIDTLDAFCDLCTRHARRPLMRHGLACSCVGGDEACLARVIAAAAETQREDALMLALVLVRGDVAPGLVALSEQLGLALRRMALATAPDPGPRRPVPTKTYH